MLVFSTFFNFFLKTSIKSIISCQSVHVFGPFTYVPVCFEKCIPGFSAFILTTDNIFFRSMPNGNWLFSSAYLSLTGENLLLVHELRVMAAVEPHLYAPCAKHLALKSVYGKSHYIKSGKLFLSRVVFELAQGLLVSKTSDLDSLCKELVRKSIAHM